MEGKNNQSTMSKVQTCLHAQFGYIPSQIELQNLQSFTCIDKGLINNDLLDLSQLPQLIELNLKGNDLSQMNLISTLTQLTNA